MEQPYNSSYFDEEFARFAELPLQSTLQALHIAAKNAAIDIPEGQYTGVMSGYMPGEAATIEVMVIHMPTRTDGDIDGSFRRFAVFAERCEDYTSRPQFELWYKNGESGGQSFFELRTADRLCTENDALMLMGQTAVSKSEAA